MKTLQLKTNVRLLQAYQKFDLKMKENETKQKELHLLL